MGAAFVCVPGEFIFLFMLRRCRVERARWQPFFFVLDADVRHMKKEIDHILAFRRDYSVVN